MFRKPLVFACAATGLSVFAYKKLTETKFIYPVSPTCAEVAKAFCIPADKLVSIDQFSRYIQVNFKSDMPKSVFDRYELKLKHDKNNPHKIFLSDKNKALEIFAPGMRLDEYKEFAPLNAALNDSELRKYFVAINLIGTSYLKFNGDVISHPIEMVKLYEELRNNNIKFKTYNPQFIGYRQCIHTLEIHNLVEFNKLVNKKLISSEQVDQKEFDEIQAKYVKARIELLDQDGFDAWERCHTDIHEMSLVRRKP